MLASLLVIFMGSRQMPLELELRTIYPVLAKPVTRTQVLLGKALPTWAVGAGALVMFSIVTLAMTPHLPYQQPEVLAQALALKIVALAMLTALTLWLSLWLPLGVTMLLAGALTFLGRHGDQHADAGQCRCGASPGGRADP